MREKALADRIRVLGEDHPQTLDTRNHLVGAYYMAGHLAQAVQLCEQNLAHCVRVLGEDHPLTKTVRGNLMALSGG